MTLPKICVVLFTLWRKEIARFMRIWVQTLLPPAITMTLYFVIFGSLIGARIGHMDGIPYMDFIAPGIIMMAIITNSYANVVSSFFSTKFQHSIEEILVAPVPYYIILLGYAGGGVIRGALVGGVVTLVALYFTDLQVQNILLMLVVVLLTSTLFSICGLINAIFANKFDDISIIPTFILTPLTYLGGVFYSIDLLPPFWQTVSLMNPVVYMVNSFRYSILGVSDINIDTALLVIIIFNIWLGAWCLYLLKKGIGIRS